MEEKIIERADRKLFLDAAVIQQGRLAEQHSTADKNDLMKMVKFGADQILSGKGGTYTDEDIDALIAKGEEKTSAIQAKLKTDAQHNLASFSLLGEDETNVDTFDFGGENYRDAKKKNAGNFINLPTRERKRNYDVDGYFQETMGGQKTGVGTNRANEAKKRKKNNYQDFQLFNREQLDYFNLKERDLAAKREEKVSALVALREKAKHATSVKNSRVDVPPGESREELTEKANQLERSLSQHCLSPEEEAQKKKLLDEGFPDWSRKDFRSFCASIERFGRFDIINIVKDVSNQCGKSEREVKRYYVSFWLNYKRLSDWKKTIEKIEKGERRILKLRQIRDTIQFKVERHLEQSCSQILKAANNKVLTSSQLLDLCWQSMTLSYIPGTKNRAYTEEEDAFLLCMMHRHGFGSVERIRLEIRRAWQFRFDWHFKSRGSQEIQKRCEAIVKIVEKENEEIAKKEKEDEKKAYEANLAEVTTADH